GAIAVHKSSIERKGPAGALQPDVHGKVCDRLHHSSSLVSSTVGSPSATHNFFWASMMISARSSLRRRRAFSRLSRSICRADGSDLGPRFLGASATRSDAPICLRQLESIEE